MRVEINIPENGWDASSASCDEKENDSFMSSTIHTLAWHNIYVCSRVWRDAESSVASLKPDQILSSDEAECSDGLDLWPSPHVGCWANTEPPHSLPGSHSATQPAEEERRPWWPGRPVTLAELQVAGRQAGGLWCRPLVILLERILPLIWSAMVGRGARCPRCGKGWSARRSNVGGVLTPWLNLWGQRSAAKLECLPHDRWARKSWWTKRGKQQLVLLYNNRTLLSVGM